MSRVVFAASSLASYVSAAYLTLPYDYGLPKNVLVGNSTPSGHFFCTTVARVLNLLVFEALEVVARCSREQGHLPLWGGAAPLMSQPFVPPWCSLCLLEFLQASLGLPDDLLSPPKGFTPLR